MYYRNEDGKIIEGYNSNILSNNSGKMPLWLIVLIIFIIVVLVVLCVYYCFIKG